MKLTANQKKIFGTILIAVMVVVEVFFMTGLIAILAGEPETDVAQTTFSFLFVMALMYLPLRYGIKLRRTGIRDSRVRTPITDATKMIRITVKIDLRDYRRMLLRATLRHPVVLFMMVIGSGFLVTLILNTDSAVALPLTIGLVFLTLPFLSVLLASRNYNASKTLHETVLYEFNIDNVVATGETFNTTLRWTSLYKITEMNDWFLLHTSSSVAMIIPKRSFTSSEDQSTFRSFAHHAKGVIKELKA